MITLTYVVEINTYKKKDINIKIDGQDYYDDVLEDDEGTEHETVEFSFIESLEDIIAVLYEKKYGKSYDSSDWYLEPGAKEFYKQVEDDYLHNRIDKATYADEEGLEILKEKYRDYDEVFYQIKEIIADYRD